MHLKNHIDRCFAKYLPFDEPVAAGQAKEPYQEMAKKITKVLNEGVRVAEEGVGSTNPVAQEIKKVLEKAEYPEEALGIFINEETDHLIGQEGAEKVFGIVDGWVNRTREQLIKWRDKREKAEKEDSEGEDMWAAR